MRYPIIISALLAGLGLASLALAGPVVATPPVAPAPAELADAGTQAEAVGDVIVLHGTNSGEGIDPKIGDLKQLRQPPFSAYNSYKLLNRAEMPLDLAQAAELKLPDDGEFTLTLKDVLKPKKAKDPKRFVLEASITKPDGSAFLPGVTVKAEPDKIFFIAGPKYKKGILVLGIRVK